jgi:hypothetical protein
MKIAIGRLQGPYGGSLTLECQVAAGRAVSVTMYLSDGDGRTKGVFLHLTANSFYQLRDCIRKADEVFRTSMTHGPNQTSTTGYQGAEVKIPVGNIEATYGGSLLMECEVSAANAIKVTIFAWDGDGRTKGVFLRLPSNLFYELRELTCKADEVFCLQALGIDSWNAGLG